MTDRKHYSKRRDENIRRKANDAITELRIFVLSRHLEHQSAVEQDKQVLKFLSFLPELISAEYRRSYAVLKPLLEESE